MRKRKSIRTKLLAVFTVVGMTLAMTLSVSASAPVNNPAVFSVSVANPSVTLGRGASTTDAVSLSAFGATVSSITVGVGCGMPECLNDPGGCGDGCFDQWGFCTCMGTTTLQKADIISVNNPSGAFTASVNSSGNIVIQASSGATCSGVPVTVTGYFYGQIGGYSYAASKSIILGAGAQHPWTATATIYVTVN